MIRGKSKKVKDPMTQPTNGMIVSDDFKRRAFMRLPVLKTRRQKINVFVAVIVLLVAGGLYFIVRPKGIQAPPKVDISGVFEYSDMTKEQANYYLYTKTGLTLEYLGKKGVSIETVKTFDVAIEAAEALASVQDKQAALRAYAVAQGLRTDDGTHQFYLDYARYALAVGDKQTWKKQMLLARDIAAKNETPISNDIYSISEVQKIDNEIVIVEGSSSE